MKKIAHALQLVAFACLIVFASLVVLQGRLLYHPDKAAVADLLYGRLRPWPSADDFRGLVAEPSGPLRGTVVVFHGNAGHAGHRGYYADVLAPLGLRVILAEYPGYGPRPGKPEEETLVGDAEATLALAHGRYGDPLVVIGESLGSGVAAAASNRQRELVKGLMLITPWDRLENVALHHYPWLPIHWFLRDRYDSAAHLARFDRPIMVAVAERDSMVPTRLGTNLYNSLPAPRLLSVIPAAEHNDWPDQVDQVWWSRAMEFLLGSP